MPLKITIEKTVVLDDTYMSKEEWDEFFRGNLDGTIEIINEDQLSFLEQCGGLKGIITKAEFVEQQDDKTSP